MKVRWLGASDRRKPGASKTVVVPACDDVGTAPPGDLVDAVRAAHERGARLVSLCTGAFVLAAAGVLDGRRATTHGTDGIDGIDGTDRVDTTAGAGSVP